MPTTNMAARGSSFECRILRSKPASKTFSFSEKDLFVKKRDGKSVAIFELFFCLEGEKRRGQLSVTKMVRGWVPCVAAILLLLWFLLTNFVLVETSPLKLAPQPRRTPVLEQPRVAICFVGALRTLPQIADNVFANLVLPLNLNTTNSTLFLLRDGPSLAAFPALAALFRPAVWRQLPRANPCRRDRYGYYSQLAALSACADEVKRLEVERGESFHWVVRTRPDIAFLRPIRFDLVGASHDTVFLPSGGYDDKFAIVPRELMDTYFRVIDAYCCALPQENPNIHDLTGGRINPERYHIKRLLIDNNISLGFIDAMPEVGEIYPILTRPSRSSRPGANCFRFRHPYVDKVDDEGGKTRELECASLFPPTAKPIVMRIHEKNQIFFNISFILGDWKRRLSGRTCK
jgi:hypothetical protein